MKQQLLAYPGTYLVKPIKEETTGINLGERKNKRIMQGEVIDIGAELATKYGGLQKPYGHLEIGDTLYFLSYEGDYDLLVSENEEYRSVLFEDGRGYVKQKK